MADAVGSLTKIVDIALKNRKDCHHIRSRVERVRHTLSLCESNTELMESPAVYATIEALGEVLGEALELVTGCQEETTAANAVCLCCTAGKLSKQLSKVDRAISDVNSEATFAILVYHISRQTRDGARPVLPAETPMFGEWDYAPESATFSSFGSSPRVINCSTKELEQTETLGYVAIFNEVREDRHGSSGFRCQSNANMQLLNPHKEGHYSPTCMEFWKMRIPFFPHHLACTMEAKPSPWKVCDTFWKFHRRKSAGSSSDGETTGLTLLHQIAGVALKIKVAAETVLLRNKEDCNEIGRRASRVSTLLSRLEDTEMTKDAAARAALDKILETFRRAHAAVVACQRRRIADFVCYFRFQPGKLSDELRRVLDQIVLDIDALIDIFPSIPIARNRAI